MTKSVTIKDRTGTLTCKMLKAYHEHQAETVKYDGNYYRVIRKFDSQYTSGTSYDGYVPVINLNSGAIRGINYDAMVEVVILEIIVHKCDH